VLGKYLVRKPSDTESGHAQRTIVISGNPLEPAAALNATSNVEAASGMVTPVPVHREREIRFSDGTQASDGG
jgi:hypothetical protein